MSERHHYVACGLAIVSDMVIPGLPTAPVAHPDLDVSIGDFDRARAGLGVERIRYISRERHADGTPQLTVWTGSSGAHRLRYHDGTEFVIDARAALVSVRWDEPLTEEDAAVYFLGPVLGFVIRLRGLVPLHASAVIIGGRACVFLGGAGAGKSTTAAAFASLGYPVLSDDLVPIVDRDGEFFAHPSHPRLSVWPDSATALFGAANNLPRLTPTWDKRYLELQNGYRFHDMAAPLDVIYLLGDGNQMSVSISGRRALRPREALMALVRNTYGNYLLDASMRRQEFELMGRIAQHVPVRALSFGDDITELVERCRVLADERLADLESL
jgi:hypothetical protein